MAWHRLFRFRYTLLGFVVCWGTTTLYARDQETVDPGGAQRMGELIDVFKHPQASGANLGETRKAIAELAKIGPAAVPQLVQAILTNAELDNRHRYSASALDQMGIAAVDAVRKEWEALGTRDRWKLMRFRGQYDYRPVLRFALASLHAADDEGVRLQAIEYLGKHREIQARPRLLTMLNEEVPRLRWHVIDALTKIRGTEVVDAFIPLLAADTWVAKGEGLTPLPGIPPYWWPDGRFAVIFALHELRAAKSAPAIVAILREKGPGKGYLAEFIFPALVEFHDRESLDELRRIAAADPSEVLAYRDLKGRVQHEAREAIKKIESFPQ